MTLIKLRNGKRVKDKVELNNLKSKLITELKGANNFITDNDDTVAKIADTAVQALLPGGVQNVIVNGFKELFKL